MGIDIRACVREAGRCERGWQKWKSGWGLALEHV